MSPRGFDEKVLPHLDAAFNYARWLTRNDGEAEDVVQDACVRAMRFFPSLRDDDARAWLLAIVRNAWYSRLSRRTSAAADIVPLNSAIDVRADESLDPEAAMAIREHLSGCAACRQRVADRQALGRLVRTAPYYPAPDSVRARVSTAVRRSLSTRRMLTWAAAATLLLAVSGGLLIVRSTGSVRLSSADPI